MDYTQFVAEAESVYRSISLKEEEKRKYAEDKALEFASSFLKVFSTTINDESPVKSITIFNDIGTFGIIFKYKGKIIDSPGLYGNFSNELAKIFDDSLKSSLEKITVEYFDKKILDRIRELFDSLENYYVGNISLEGIEIFIGNREK